MRQSNIRRAVRIWLAALVVGALALLSALQWAPKLVPIAGGFVLLAAMLGLAALDFMLLRQDGPDQSSLDHVEPVAFLEDELKRQDRGSVPRDAASASQASAESRGPPATQRNA